MSRQKKKTPFQPWTTLKPNGIEERYIRLGNSLMKCSAFKELSSTAKLVWIYMLLESGGQREFEFSASVYTALMDKKTFLKARNELIEAGFIEIKQNNAHVRKANVYAFSEKWKEKAR